MTATTLTLEEILREAFTATKHPATQTLDVDKILAPSEVKGFGKMSVAQATLFHWATQLSSQYKETLNGASSADDLSLTQKATLDKISEDYKWCNGLMWKMIKDEFPKGTDPNVFGRMTILPDWKVAGVYLTDEEKRQQEEEEKILRSLQAAFA